MKKMKIAILGTRGIPNNYGGYEQYAEYIGAELVLKGHDVLVYRSSEHPSKSDTVNGVSCKSIFCPEKTFGSFGHLLYDFLCTRDAVRMNYDIILHCGYQSASPSIFFYRNYSKGRIVCNMDGLEWKRDKWSKWIKIATKLSEKLAVKSCDYLISDNEGIKDYYELTFKKKTKFIAYGANVKTTVDPLSLKDYDVVPDEYFILVARLEPENNITTILDGYCSAKSSNPFLVVGNFKTKYGTDLKKKYESIPGIKFLGGIYNQKKLDALRKYSCIYFHGHSVGGTNPSLLEAMSLGSFIAYHDNEFNSSVIQGNGLKFKNANEVKNIINSDFGDKKLKENYRENCLQIISKSYNWKHISEEHERYFLSILDKKIN